MSESRSAAIIARNITSPSEGPIMEHYEGYYDCVYMILHPFIKIIDPEKFNKSNSLFVKKDYVDYAQKVSWKEFLELSRLENINRLDIALRNLIRGLDKKYENEEDVNILKKTFELNNIHDPGEGHFNPLLVDDMLKALVSLNHDWIYIGDEFGFERKTEYIQDIIDNKIATTFGHENWYTTMNEVLYSTHWDSHFTMLCSDKKTVEKILEEYPFEGFYCDAETEVYWSIRSPTNL